MTTSPPHVSVLLPTYNGARYLAEQLDSILTQRFGDFELLIVDDGSSDDTPALLDDYVRRDSRVRLIPSTENAGQKARLLQLVCAARAPLLSFADQDDRWHPDRTGLLVEALGDAVMSYGRSELMDAGGNLLGRNIIEHFGFAPSPGDRLSLLFRPRVSGHAMLVRREAVTEMAFRRFQPFDWLIALDSAFSGDTIYVHEAVVFHRIHGANQSNAAVGKIASRLHRLRPGPVYAEFQAIRRRRSHFVEMLEHLTYSTVLERRLQIMFGQLLHQCQFDWFQPGSGLPYSNRPLRRLLLDNLRPFAGSEQDWAVAVDHVTGMTQSQFHPRSLYQTAKMIAWY